MINCISLRTAKFSSQKHIYLNLCILAACLLATKATSQDRFWGSLPNGNKNVGMIYNFKTDGSDFKVAKLFTIEMKEPLGYLVDGSNGYVYGVSQSSGAYSKGVIYKLSTDGNDFSIIHDFNGELPAGTMTLFNGKLYGATASGGVSGFGSLFTIALDGSNFQVIYEFTGTTGASPNGGLLIGSDNNLYGAASSGGANGKGTVFKINGTTNAFTKLYDFPSGGTTPTGSLIEGADGNLYGTIGLSTLSAGSVFSISKTGTNFKYVRIFNEWVLGQNIYGGIAESTDGKLFGTFTYGGANGKGGLYKVNKDGSNYQVVYSFQGNDGAYPSGRLILHDGYFYGATSDGGANGRGVVYKLSEDGTSFSKILDLKKKDGYGIALFTANSKLYYSTYHGGVSGNGAIGILDLVNKTTNIIKDFNSIEGAIPTGKLLYHTNGYIYGTASHGGPTGNGVLFKIDPVSESYDVMYQFKEDTACCVGSIIESFDGSILGISEFSNGNQVFKYDVKNNTLTEVFNVVDRRVSNIWEGIETEIYGSTSNLSASERALYSTDSIRSTFSSVDYVQSRSPWLTVDTDTATFMLGYTFDNKIMSYDFNENSLGQYYYFANANTNGSGLTGELVPLKNKTILGVTGYGGTSSGGTIFSIDTKAKEISKIFDFPAESYPIDIERAADTLFYGVLFQHGSDPSAANRGAIYKYDLTGGFSVIQNFKDIDGYFANAGLTKVATDEAMLKVYGNNLKFGGVEVSKASVKYLYIRNFGHTALTVSDINLPTGFSVDENVFAVDPGNTKMIKVFFAPLQDTIAYSGVLQVISNAETGTYTLPISGYGHVVTSVGKMQENFISVYPNPTLSEVHIKSPTMIESVKVMSLLGNPVMDASHIKRKEYTFNLSNHTTGIYILFITDPQGRVSRRKIFYQGAD